MATSEERAAHRSVIKYCVDRGMTPVQTKREMEKTDMCGNVSRSLVYAWHKRFSTESNVSTTENRGRSKKSQASLVRKLKDVLDVDRRQTVRELADSIGISKSSVQRLLADELRMSRVCARWVPRLLSSEEIMRCQDVL